MKTKFFCQIYTRSVFFLVLTGLFAFAAMSASAATITVTTNADENGAGAACALREAVIAANTNAAFGGCPAGAGADTIQFALPLFSTPQTIALITGEMQVTSPITIVGTGANLLTIQNIQAQAATSRHFNVPAGGALTLSGASLTGGNTPLNTGAASIIVNTGTLNLTNVHITGNTSGGYGALLLEAGSTGTINNSTISNNVANGTFAGGGGGGIDNSGALTIVNSTISGNIKNGSTANGGGIYNFAGSLTITNTTVTDNQAAGAGSAGGVFRSGGTTNIRNTIIAANRTNATVPDVAGAFTSSGYNLIGNLGTATGFTAIADQTNVSNANAGLAPLGNYGGQTPTHGLIGSSFAVDKGLNFGSTTDQRGATRPYDNPAVANAAGGNGTDIGAFELQAPTAAGVSVTGMVTDEAGRGISRATVYMTDQNGATRTTRTNNFGQYSFTEVAAGQTYIFTVFTKQYQFDPIVKTVAEDLFDLNFMPQTIEDK